MASTQPTIPEAHREPGWATSTTSTLAGEEHHTPLEKQSPDAGSVAGKTDTDTEAAPEKPLDEEPPAEDEYPSGTKLVFIVVALVLAIFLLALDMVRFSLSFLSFL